MAIQKTEAIILRTQPFRSSSLIVTFYSRSFGKMKGIAKGVRDERQRRSSLFELFSRIEIIFYEKTRSDLHLISEAFMLETYEPIRTRLDAVVYASYFVELVDQVCEIQDPHEEVYGLIDCCFRYLPSIPGSRLARLFEIKLLKEIGWIPYLEACFQCGNKSLEAGYFSPRQGALLCNLCVSQFPDAHILEAEVLRAMRIYMNRDLEECIRLGLSKSAEKGLEMTMKRFFLERLNYPLKSSIFLEKISQPA